MEGNTFKSSVFGGFNREDVIHYIEKSSAEANERIAALETERDALRSEINSLRDEIQAGADTAERLSSELTEARGARESAENALSEANAELERLRAKLSEVSEEGDALRSQLSAAQEEKAALAAQVDRFRPQAEEYSSVKSHIAGIELSAQQRADALDAATRAKLSELLDACRAQCEKAMGALGDACVNVSAELRKADVMVAQLPAVFNTLRNDLDELEEFK